MKKLSYMLIISVLCLFLAACGKSDVPTAPSAVPDTSSSAASSSSGAEDSSSKDIYNTDPVPSGKPAPVEPDSVSVDTAVTHTCTFMIECTTILDNLDSLEDGKLEAIPEDCIVLPETTVTFSEGESVFDVLQRICKDNKIHMEASWTPIYNSAYIEGISNLYEFDCGDLSGWMYSVNGWYPNYGCSRYALNEGDVVEWRYTCDLGADVGGGYAAAE